MLRWAAVVWGGFLFGSIHAATLSGNGYEFTVAISEDVTNLVADQRLPFLDALKVSFRQCNFTKTFFGNLLTFFCLLYQSTMTTTSKLLFDATDSYVYFKKINILLPRAWTTSNLTGTLTSA